MKSTDELLNAGMRLIRAVSSGFLMFKQKLYLYVRQSFISKQKFSAKRAWMVKCEGMIMR